MLDGSGGPQGEVGIQISPLNNQEEQQQINPGGHTMNTQVEGVEEGDGTNPGGLEMESVWKTITEDSEKLFGKSFWEMLKITRGFAETTRTMSDLEKTEAYAKFTSDLIKDSEIDSTEYLHAAKENCIPGSPKGKFVFTELPKEIDNVYRERRRLKQALSRENKKWLANVGRMKHLKGEIAEATSTINNMIYQSIIDGIESQTRNSINLTTN